MATERKTVKKTAERKPTGKQSGMTAERKRKVSPVIVKRQQSPVMTEAELAAQSRKSLDLTMMIAMRIKQSERDGGGAVRESGGDFGKRPTSRANGRNTVRFPAADLKDFRRRLLEARESALLGVNAMKATGFNESDDHEADGGDGTNQTLRLQALGQMGNINRTIMQIDEALHRIDEGTYGVCTSCGQLIRKPRLLNQPFVLTCMECQVEMERTSGK